MPGVKAVFTYDLLVMTTNVMPNIGLMPLTICFFLYVQILQMPTLCSAVVP